MDADPRGLSGEWARYQRHHSEPPPPDLAGFVDRFWTVDWDYARPFLQKIVPYPQVHLTGEPGVGPLRISGPASRFVTRELHGRGRVVGVAFRPGTARALAGVPVATLADRRVPAGAPFDGPGPPDVDGLAERLRAVLPPDGPDRAARDAHDLVAAVVADRELTRVDRHGGYSVRSLQRIFHEHVGLGPKWVIRRYRLHEVTELMAGGCARPLGRGRRHARVHRPGPPLPGLRRSVRGAADRLRAPLRTSRACRPGPAVRRLRPGAAILIVDGAPPRGGGTR
ncbi:Transcriptional regulator, AraC family [Pseudonocardia sp. Ae168_Ps1]|uniref:DUF6597 domain-containing transcriptional factor n=1 Tax=unclassified Pseudonocardia TaxID=2619320 RepID=UPI00094B70B5|nr:MULTISPECIES: DUF6597 domain-containing transcriptional factor [unclassified Pseudonocardia]OLL73359.1 Transcriptional regulator, AraC family [Pseudonocardia sp. Ae150A_Ps1]OLL79334.1 Transcriptional regulator, AraC family [Pseudonocardia sp. Ae168_Ps1]OLL86531.1 Transcriptional regulator, AraC family [Pseudonocardia sp. Ae263_Ps1]OLL93421.1 Transcriptional regulator, AraC family [Pseudonocardia sp. Ae356_Ps1]